MNWLQTLIHTSNLKRKDKTLLKSYYSTIYPRDYVKRLIAKNTNVQPKKSKER